MSTTLPQNPQPISPSSRFPLGRVVFTPGAEQALAESGVSLRSLLRRHQCGDWGTVCPQDAKENEYSVEHGFRILSSYPVGNAKRVWIITEADRSTSTILLPDEY